LESRSLFGKKIAHRRRLIIIKRAYEASYEREREKNLIDDQVLPMKNAVAPVTTEDEII
jgi:hypothetical protein